MLPLDPRHEMYWEESGNPQGIPVVFLHGGPGAGAGPVHRRFFDPDAYRVILYDQRGCGRSRPHGEIRDNTTSHLVADLEQLRQYIGIDQWMLFGGSWGSTLALAYGVAHPQRCLGFVLRGVFLGRSHETDWFLNGIGLFFPEARRRFVEFLPHEERDDLLSGYRRRLQDPDPDIHMPAARAWRDYEAGCSTLIPKDMDSLGQSDVGALSLARMELHYFIHDMFLDSPLLESIGKIAHLPCAIVQGRYDVICPPCSADDLARAWPGSSYTIVPDAGHSALEPGIRAELVAATERMKHLLG
ncbi:prolyl aminopeptidase [Magnetospira sp. QH-2]|uniref:prolyl aminopeptidase n=1 Tax=Magnetospira sp. (strain QH-2) TaxID=1288970 RepID=UPI0005F9A987|nr:prolyl aminopeptidase [Magnetospira sp. QH-2]